jgi:hypothetical protein
MNALTLRITAFFFFFFFLIDQKAGCIEVYDHGYYGDEEHCKSKHQPF